MEGETPVKGGRAEERTGDAWLFASNLTVAAPVPIAEFRMKL